MAKGKIVSIQGKSAALALPLQVLQVRLYRVVCRRFRKLFSSWTDSSSSWLQAFRSELHSLITSLSQLQKTYKAAFLQ